MSFTKQDLIDAHCYFSVDRVSDPDMTLFKQRARLQQARWREARGYEIGSHRPLVENGSRLLEPDAESGHNFLSDAIRAQVYARLAAPQMHQTLDARRLKGDLLSSMPMCFNLFGELASSPKRAAAAAEFLLPGAGPGPVEVRFEWSPGRREAAFTNDRTAFDVALVLGEPGAPRQVIGIETKYHEHAVLEKKPTEASLARHESQREHYLAIAKRSKAFKRGWQSHVLGTELEQIWRDHLLLLSMLQHPADWIAGRYLLVYPEHNLSFGAVAEAYRGVLKEDDTTFGALTLEALLQARVLHTRDTAKQFRERYLW